MKKKNNSPSYSTNIFFSLSKGRVRIKQKKVKKMNLSTLENNKEKLLPCMQEGGGADLASLKGIHKFLSSAKETHIEFY